MGDDLAAVLDQYRQQPVFNGCYMNFAIIQEHLPFRQVNPEVIENESGLFLTGLQDGLMTKGYPNSSQQFACTKRLDQIVIGAGVKSLDFILLLFPCGKDDNRDYGPLA